MAIKDEHAAVAQFCAASQRHAEAIEAGQSRVGNKACSQVIEALKWLQTNQATALLHSSMDSPNTGTRSWAAAYFLLASDAKAEKVLAELACRNDIHGLGAEITLREWRAGRLTSLF